jgi:hypothetical protein
MVGRSPRDHGCGRVEGSGGCLGKIEKATCPAGTEVCMAHPNRRARLRASEELRLKRKSLAEKRGVLVQSAD